MGIEAAPAAVQKDAVDDDAMLLQSVRMKMSSHDLEAMRRARWTMIEGSDGAPSQLYSQPPAAKSGPRRSSLNNELEMATEPPRIKSTSAAPRVRGGQPQTAPSSTTNGAPSSPPFKPDYVIAVVGHDGVGKSTVIRRAIKSYNVSTPVTTTTHDGHTITSSYAQIKAGGKLTHDCAVEFVEVNLRALDLSGVAKVWPAQMQSVSGAILCYDADRRDTLRGLSEALHQLCPALPIVLFACKSDPGKKTEVDAQVGDSIGHPYNVGLIEVTTATTQGKHKMRTGLRWLLYRLEERQRREARRAAGRTSPDGAKSPSSPRPPSGLTSSGLTSDERAILRAKSRRGGRERRTESIDGYSDTHSSSSSLGWMIKNGLGSSATSTEESHESTPTVDGEKSAGPEITTPSQSQSQPSTTGEPPELYTTLEELMNRLFTAIVSTENDAFVQAFFMTYRRFCQPRDLMKEFHDRFIEVEQYAVSRDIRLWALMKLAGALVTWTTRYPGDLADSEVQARFRKTLGLLLKHTFLAHITADLVNVEQMFESTVDLDDSWSFITPTVIEDIKEAPLDSSNSAVEIVLDKDDEADSTTPVSKKAPSSRTMSTTSLSIDADPYAPRKTASTTDSSSDISRSIASINSGDESGHQRWNAAVQTILSMDAHVFALELTRMQWELFSAIRPRDIFRHDFGKERGDPVGLSIAFFNHVSRWVSTMMMAPSKPKHRAKVYEAFVRISHQLRRLNNYDTLCAVLAGLRETSVHRLSHTHNLIRLDATLQREFQSHLKLMDPRGGYVHYRRALQADSTYGHAAIPLLTTVLGLVSRLQAGRPEDVRADGLIQWDKFARFGQILSVIPEFQSRGAMVPGSVTPAFRRLIEDTPIIGNEDALYERSRLIEPGGSHGGGMLRKLASLAL
ncbi:hypothetical protein Q8F55_001370 [Vanrija albida]|uniref:Ras-GEF domain-containing protein n=1 Tax=Vanrija albida TaxID=181172 RepID=A0ABR3QFV5_9TREE